ncbi:bis(5'-nucleosyl)-tetraphosphatase (symmetrical) YqeK [Alkalibacter mobilis]|uniref:bis(5'-nucleosyl)-tetraphosphatase (symmetrical) YqeK n=1 Tax=Alkalibacter mobilis TaxID=2787712 RepID=UPI00189D1A81|nr:bis(5'-nucleosyl)-tetraphosphatase (symmetrical) YqeK [Alkalibacter mobilis]MBF7097219.1 bis(5'-nucleosyl)-tetraphosphatase (symmetrical) YqeK [Alkalibacter mobilis]
MDYKKLKGKVKEMISHKRYVHTLGVVESAIDLADRYGCDIEKTRIAALCHDCAKNLTREELLEKSERYGLDLDEIVFYETQLMHGPVGSAIAKFELGIDDEEIISAISHHTTGKKEMGLLEKIIYLSDFIEPGRDYTGVEELRKLSMVDLDRALIMAFDNTIRYVLSLNSVLHPNTIEARNNLIMKIGG